MKIRVLINNPNRNTIVEKLTQAGFEITDDAKYTLSEDNFVLQEIIGKKDTNYVVIPINEVFYFESYNHDVYTITKSNTYKIREKLYHLESILDASVFIRINQSTILNRQSIKHISSTLGLRYVIKLVNDKELIVTRSYYYKFKEYIGI